MRSASVGPSTSSMTSAVASGRLLQSVDRGDVWMIERGQHLGLALESRQPIRVGRDRRRQHLDRDARFRLVSVARYTSPMPPTPIWAVTSYGPRRLPGARDKKGRLYVRRCESAGCEGGT